MSEIELFTASMFYGEHTKKVKQTGMKNYPNQKYPNDNTPLILTIMYINSKGELELREKNIIKCQHSNIDKQTEEKFMNLIKEFNNMYQTVQIEWDGNSLNTINFILS